MAITQLSHSARDRAYTLIEVLIVVALLGLASALLIPYLVRGDSLQLQAAVRHIVADLSFAQSDALSHQEYRRVHFYDDGSGYCLVRIDQADIGTEFDPDTADYIHDPIAPGHESGHYIFKLTEEDGFEEVSITDVDIDGEDGQDLYYDPLGGTVMDGGVPGIGGTIEITAGGETYEIDIAPFTGKLTVSLQ